MIGKNISGTINKKCNRIVFNDRNVWNKVVTKTILLIFFSFMQRKSSVQFNILLKTYLFFTILVNIIYPSPPPQTHFRCSVGFGWFEFEWDKFIGYELQTQFYLVKLKKPKENLKMQNKFSDGFRCFEFEGNVIIFYLIPSLKDYSNQLKKKNLRPPLPNKLRSLERALHKTKFLQSKFKGVSKSKNFPHFRHHHSTLLTKSKIC